MRVVANSTLIVKRISQARTLSLTGLGIMGVALVFSFQPSLLQIPINGQTYPLESVFVSWGLLLIGYLISNAALYLTNVYGGPRLRPDAVINEFLHDLSDDYICVHHFPPIPHVLFTPTGGVYALCVKAQSGLMRFRGGIWRQDMPLRFLRVLFVPFEGIGNPLGEAPENAKAISALLAAKGLPDLPVKPLIVFVSAEATVQDSEGESPIPAVHIKKLVAYLRNIEQSTGPSTRIANATLEQGVQALTGPFAAEALATRKAPAPLPSTAVKRVKRPARKHKG